jgi:hypothetical protein
MLHTHDVDSYGLHNPTTVVHELGDDAISRDREQAAGEELDFEQWARENVERVDKLTADAGVGKVEPGPAIAHLEHLEAELRPVWQQVRRTAATARNLESQAMRMPAAVRVKLMAQTATLLINVSKLLNLIGSVLRAYRDGRWELMAIQAENEPEGEAPVFDDAKSLLAFLS